MVEAIEALIGPVDHGTPHGVSGSEAGLPSPGMLLSHYAPTLPVRLDARSVAAEDALLAFGPALPGAGTTFELSPTGNPAEAAARLFEGLRDLDARGQALGLRGIAVMPVPDAGLGLAINDRLRRAAAPRPAP
jgi:L-threonylcarbamoyladenylate synthase